MATVTRFYDEATQTERFTADNVQREERFSVELLRLAAEDEIDRLTYDGDRVVLDVDNGRWVWRVTHVDEARGIVYGVWPD